MSVVNLEQRLQKIEAARFFADQSIKALSDAELVAVMRQVSDDPNDHAFATWFEAGCEGDIPAGALERVMRSLR